MASRRSPVPMPARTAVAAAQPTAASQAAASFFNEGFDGFAALLEGTDTTMETAAVREEAEAAASSTARAERVEGRAAAADTARQQREDAEAAREAAARQAIEAMDAKVDSISIFYDLMLHKPTVAHLQSKFKADAAVKMRSHGVTLVDSIKPGVAKGSLYKEHESDGTISPAQAVRAWIESGVPATKPIFDYCGAGLVLPPATEHAAVDFFGTLAFNVEKVLVPINPSTQKSKAAPTATWGPRARKGVEAVKARAEAEPQLKERALHALDTFLLSIEPTRGGLGRGTGGKTPRGATGAQERLQDAALASMGDNARVRTQALKAFFGKWESGLREVSCAASCTLFSLPPHLHPPPPPALLSPPPPFLPLRPPHIFSPPFLPPLLPGHWQ